MCTLVKCIKRAFVSYVCLLLPNTHAAHFYNVSLFPRVTWKYWKDRWRNRNKPTTASAVSAPCSTTQPPTAESSMKMGSSECNSTPGTASCQAHCISSDQPVEASLLAAGQENLESPEAQGPAAKMEDSNMGTGVRQRLQQSAATE
uniref:Uncharacterized protein n=1 Tax=Dunaliella tertiolecta TaxID=3047 RepID=A0A7S3R4X3_DUNTE